MTADDPYDLARFVTAQEPVLDRVRAELRRGRKASHWMWFVFPQAAGLGTSATSRHFALETVGAARAFLAHPVLGPRLLDCVDALLERTFEAARWLNARSVGIAGGVSANSRLRADAESRGAAAGLPVFVPPLALSTDNAAMIGAAGLRRYRTGTPDNWQFNAEASLPLTP